MAALSAIALLLVVALRVSSAVPRDSEVTYLPFIEDASGSSAVTGDSESGFTYVHFQEADGILVPTAPIHSASLAPSLSPSPFAGQIYVFAEEGEGENSTTVTTATTATTATTTLTAIATTMVTTTTQQVTEAPTTTVAVTATTTAALASPTSSVTTTAEVVVLSGSLELTFVGGSEEELLGELKAATEAAVASGLAQLLDVPQAWIQVALSAPGSDGGSGRRLRQSTLAVIGRSGADRRLQAQQLVATYTITMPTTAKGENDAETIASVQDTFSAAGGEQLTDVLQASISSALGSEFQVQVDAFSVPSTSPVGTTTAAGNSALSFAAPRVGLTAAHALILAALIAKMLVL